MAPALSHFPILGAHAFGEKGQYDLFAPALIGYRTNTFRSGNELDAVAKWVVGMETTRSRNLIRPANIVPIVG
jgi:hypothetical protein